ncbi:MAG: 2-phospho-L-lactate guanylyltransferase [Thermoleophilia bacterium]
MDVHVLVPLKRLDVAKSRLASVMPTEARSVFMREMLDHVLAAIAEAGFQRVTIVTGERLDGLPVWDDNGLPWNDALAAAMDAVVAEDVVAIVSADLPLLTASDVLALVEATPARGIAIARALDGGTNALSMRPAKLVTTQFGVQESASVHAALGVPSIIVDLPGLAFDIDTPADLQRLRGESV